MSISLPTYTRRQTPLRPRWYRVWTIIAAGLRQETRRPAAMFPVVAGTALTTFSAIIFLFLAPLFNPGQPVDLSFFFQPISNPTMLLFVTLAAATVGAGLIADDLQTNALTLYLSRPITHSDYLIAKGTILGTLVMMITALPLLIASLLAGLLGLVPWEVALAAMGRATLLGLVLAGFFTAVPLLLSSLTPRKAYAAAGVFAISLGLALTAGILAGATGQAGLLYLSPWEDFLAVARAGYGAPVGLIDWPGGLAILVGVAVLAALLAYLRMRSMEVVAV